MAVVDAVVSFALENITQLLKDEVHLLSGVQDKVESLQKRLRIINGFLRDTEGKRSNHEVKALINQIRDDTYEAQDVIDDYVAHKERQRSEGWRGVLSRGIDYVEKLREVDDNINKLNESIDKIYANREKYGIQQGESTEEELKTDQSLQKLRNKVAEDDEVVGFDNHSEEVIERLKGGVPRRDVVSIVGMGGLGKTTLARKVYKDYRVKDHFDCYAWAFVSQDFRPRDVLTSLLRCLKDTPEEKIKDNKGDQVSEEEVVEILKASVRSELNGLRYLIVLDDIWKIQVWREIQDAFPDDKTGSRILITSREVAFHDSPSGPYHLPLLSKEHSWELFTKKAFGGEKCPEELEDSARDMVEKCKGLPLSIVVLAGLLQHKDPSEWSNLNKDVISKIAEDEVGRVKDILKLSYENLPRTLKPCFLYLGIFPEDYEIPARRLTRLWIAEGLIEPNKDKSLEEVADQDYLKELINRNLLQMVSKRSDGGAKTCRIHDHLRELCISETEGDKFFEICTANNIDKMTGKPRRVSVHCHTRRYISAAPCNHSLTRSLFFFGPKQKSGFDYGEWKWLIKDFKLIRVMDFDQLSSFSINEEIDKLIHLKYLRADSEYFSVMKDSICDLRNLETLDIKNWRLRSIPDRIWKLKRLRHLYISGEISLPKLSPRQTFWYLQTLSTIALDKRNVELLEKGRFPDLRKLGFVGTSEGDRITSLLERLQTLEHLNTLKISRPPALVKSDKFPPNLTKITLLSVQVRYKALVEESMNALGNLPCLQILKLRGLENPNKDKYFRIPAGFKQLQVFEMTSLGCESWILEQGAMPKLRRLVIKKCEYMTQLPNELCSSTTLREVEVCSEMAEMLENLEDVKKVCRVTIKD